MIPQSLLSHSLGREQIAGADDLTRARNLSASMQIYECYNWFNNFVLQLPAVLTVSRVKVMLRDLPSAQ